MSKIVVAFFIVACVAHAQETIEILELQEAKLECIIDIHLVVRELDTKFESISRFLDKHSYKDMKKIVDASVENLQKIFDKIRSIDVSKVDLELGEFDQIIDDCKTVVIEGSDSVAYVEDFNTRIWGPVV